MEDFITTLWSGLGWPLLRLIFFISIGLILGNFIEALNWTKFVAKLAEPLIKLAHLKDIAGASFSLAFFSGVSANTMLAEAHEKGQLTDKELLFSNLFNSLPTYFLHLPTMFFITVPFIGNAAVVYVGLTLGAALLRTVAIVAMGRFFLPPLPKGCIPCRLEKSQKDIKNFKDIPARIFKRFKKRIRKILRITIPVFSLVFVFNQLGVFDVLEGFMAAHLGFFSFLPPEALGIVVFHIAAEFTAGLASAGALLGDGSLEVKEVVLALLTGNVLSSPMRAFRHQFPYYAGIFKPRLAVKLIIVNQSVRACSIIMAGTVYYSLG